MRRAREEFRKEKNIESEVMRKTPRSIPPKCFELIRCQRGVLRRILDIAVAQVDLQRPRVMTVIGELVPARMPQHVQIVP